MQDGEGYGQWKGMVSRACLARCQRQLGQTFLPHDDAIRERLARELVELRREIQRLESMQRYRAPWPALRAHAGSMTQPR
jgi:hypothetical protein